MTNLDDLSDAECEKRADLLFKHLADHADADLGLAYEEGLIDLDEMLKIATLQLLGDMYYLLRTNFSANPRQNKDTPVSQES